MFVATLAIHVAAGRPGWCVGAIATSARKRPGRHPRAGIIYVWLRLGFGGRDRHDQEGERFTTFNFGNAGTYEFRRRPQFNVPAPPLNPPTSSVQTPPAPFASTCQPEINPRTNRQVSGTDSAHEIRILLDGVGRQRVNQLTNRRDFPNPVGDVAQGKV